MPDLERDGRSELPYGLILRSSEVSGRVGEIRRWAAAGTPVRDAAVGGLPEQLLADHVPEPAARLLGTAAQEAGLRPVLTVPLSDLAVPRRPGGPDRSGAPGPHLRLEAPAPLPDEGQVLLEADATGVVRWVFPEAAVRRGGTDRAAGAQTFRVAMEQFALPAGGPAADRGIVGFGVGKVLHLLRFPIERAAGLAADFAVSRWEKRHRPYGLRLTTPQTFLASGDQPVDGAGEEAGVQVSAGRLADLADRPFLLFVHGTFSRCRTGFRGIADDEPLLHDLHRRYDGRVLVFDHPTVHLDPVDNARWLLEHLPADRRLTLDIVTHSRGGLVARHLSRDGLAGAGRPAPSVRTLVHVATPNAGTTLAEKQRLSDLLGVFTNLLALLPEELVSTTLEVVLEVVKHGAAGVLGGLDGLAAMDPTSEGLGELNASAVPTGGSVRAVTSDFEPARDAGLAMRALDGLVDRLFGVGNDLVVPTEGVHRAGSYVVPDPLVAPSASAVVHSSFFRDAQVRAGLSEWLPGS
ncbi:esterase/lipase family protein [Streptomyces sp. enrichment culture]|uniref:esterase/lipase family protein n=1 Tax=Streptomyces sp. enrichment culture TaxID=1795815 RepID=UPI003F57E116